MCDASSNLLISWYILLTAIGLTPGGSRTVHIYTQTVQQQYSTHLHTNNTAAVQYTFTHKQYSSSTVHIYTQTVQQQYSTHLHTNNTQNDKKKKQYIEQHKNIIGTVRAVTRLGELYPGICLTTEEKARKTLSQGS
jgi:hypothetical protein